ncbi:MAG: hypothetical protein ACXVAG_11580 [Vulcanimicrobiaceae bacterium]
MLRFGASLARDPAEKAANYAVEGGVAIVKVTLESDAMGVVLELNAAPAVDSKVIIRNLTDMLGYPVRPDYQPIKIATIPPSGEPAIDTASSRLALWSQSEAPLAFLVNGSEIVRDDSGAVLSSVSMDLRYDGRSIEHQIAAVDGAGDEYLASSWLQFVVRDTPWPLDADLGAFRVPLALRAFPPIPALVAQKGNATPMKGVTHLEAVTRWTYTFAYSLPFHYPQDRVHGSVQFNVGSKAAAFAGFEDAFDQMAQFVTVFPEVDRDLRTILAGIDATIDPGKQDDAKRIGDASIALGAFVEMARAIADRAENNGLTVPAPRSMKAGPLDLTFVFYVQEGIIEYGATKDALLVELVVSAFGGIDDAWVVVDLAGYVAEKISTKTSGGETRIAFVYRKDGTTDEYLPASIGQATPNRSIQLRGLDILQRQDAWTTIYVERNEELVPGKPSAKPFIYQTGNVEFANPYPPTLVSLEEILIQNIGTPGTKTSLQNHLETLFAALLKQNVEPLLTVRVEVTYSYGLLDPGGLGQPIQVPIMLQAPLTIDVSNGGKADEPTLNEMIGKWSDAIVAWFAQNTPTGDGTLNLDLGILSNLTESPMPLVELGGLVLPISYVVPALSVYSPSTTL